MAKSFLSFLDVVLDLYARLDDVVHLDVLQCLDQILNFDTSLIRLLVIKGVDLLSHISEESGVLFVDAFAFAPVSISCKVLRDFIDELVALAAVVIPNLSLCLHQFANHCFKLVFKFGQLQNEVDQERLIVGFVNGLSKSGQPTIVVQHQPSDGHVGISKAFEEGLHIVKNVFFKELTIDHIALETIKAILDHVCIPVGQVLHVTSIDVVLDSLPCSWKWLPILSDIDQIALINLDHKVVRVMLISNLSHFSLFLVEDSRSEAQEHEDELGLRRQGYRSVGWIWIR